MPMLGVKEYRFQYVALINDKNIEYASEQPTVQFRYQSRKPHFCYCNSGGWLVEIGGNGP